MKEAVATLKRLCRQRTVLSWKEWREAVEKDRRQPTLQVRCPPSHFHWLPPSVLLLSRQCIFECIHCAPLCSIIAGLLALQGYAKML